MAKRTLARKIMLSILTGAVLLGNSVAWAEAVTLGGGTTSGSGGNPVAIGTGASASYTEDSGDNEGGAIAIGQNATANGGEVAETGLGHAIAIGRNANAVANGGSVIAIGIDSNATGLYSVAIGDGAVASGDHAIALGIWANGSGDNVTALGSYAKAESDYATAVGYQAGAGINGVSVGYDAQTYEYGVAIGGKSSSDSNTKAAWESVAIGAGAQAGESSSLSVGANSSVNKSNSEAIGYNAKVDVSGDGYSSYSVALGSYSVANKAGVVSVGSGDEYDTAYGFRYIINVASLTAAEIENEEFAKYAVNVETLNEALKGVSGGAIDAYTKTEADGLLNAKANSADVYTKTEADGLLNAKANSTDVYTKTEADGLLNAKANSADVYTKTEADDLFNAKANSADVYTKTEADGLLNTKANSADVYTKTETESFLSAKANADNVYTKSETYSKTEADSLLNTKADSATTLAGYGITDAYTQGQVDELLDSKATSSDVSNLNNKIAGITRTSYTEDGQDKFTTTISDELVISPSNGNGYFKFKDLGNGTLFYGMSNASGATNPTIVMNSQNGNIETQGSLSVGNGAFVVNAYDGAGANAGDASLKGSLAVGGDANVTGGLEVGSDVKAAGDVVADANGTKVSLIGTAERVTQNETAIEELKGSVNSSISGLENRIEANENRIGELSNEVAANTTAIATNTSNIAANTQKIDDLDTRVTNNTTAIATNTQAIAELQFGLNGISGAYQSADAVLKEEVTKAYQEADKALQTSIDNEVKAREEADATLQTNIDNEVKARQEADEKHTADIAANAQSIEEIKTTTSGNAQAINGLNQRLDRTNARLNKVGAGAAALAALHPLDFDPDDKLSFSAGVGNYAGENAAALGMFYRPNEKVMLSMGGTMGNGEDMVNMGITFALDKPNNVSNSRVAMAKEINALREHVAKQDAQIAQLVMLVNQLTGNVGEQQAQPALAKEGRVRVERHTDGYEEYDRVKVVNHKEYGEKVNKK